MKIFGHPVHMMLIHFPAALLPMDLACYAIALYTGDESFLKTSFYALLGGVAIGWLATIFGALDLLKIPRDNTGAMKKALLHGGINTFVIIVYTQIAASTFTKFPALPDATTSVLIFKAVLVGIMMFGNYVGGSLILKDRIAIE